jgi:hypothetical protein
MDKILPSIDADSGNSEVEKDTKDDKMELLKWQKAAVLSMINKIQQMRA